MGQLAEFLKSEAETIRAEKQRRRASRDEWSKLLDDLYGRLDGWLAEIDPDGLLDVVADTVVLSDVALGEYKAPVRRIEVGTNTVEVVPVARYFSTTIRLPGEEKPTRAHGAVEMRGTVRNLYLFQLPDDRWFIQTEPGPLGGASGTTVVPLDAERFEAALARFLR